MGSGTTGMAAKLEGFRFIGIEKDAEYCEIARKRIEAIPTEIQAELRKLHASG
jgi:site-specific DNA-methyltransferase (adenine-specific)